MCALKENKHGDGVGFLVTKDIVNTVMGCRPVANRLVTIRHLPLSTSQWYKRTPQRKKFYGLPQNVIDQTPRKDILVVQGDWNAKVVS